MASAPSAMNDPDIARIEAILQDNASKRFVQRILMPFKSPVTMDDEDPKGKKVMTHKMSWGDADGKFYVYPKVMEDPETGELRNYGKAAFDEAMKRRDAIVMPSGEDADWFSKNYKKYWDSIGYVPEVKK